MNDSSKEESPAVSDKSGSEKHEHRKPIPQPMAPDECRDYIRKEASDRWNVIVGNLLDKAEEASVPHITLIAKLAGFEQGPMPPREPKRRTKSLARQLREEMEELEARNIAEFGE